MADDRWWSRRWCTCEEAVEVGDLSIKLYSSHSEATILLPAFISALLHPTGPYGSRILNLESLITGFKTSLLAGNIVGCLSLSFLA